MTNLYQSAARIRKAAAMAQLLAAHGFTPSDVERFEGGQWRMIAQAAQVAVPSATTRGLVVTILSAAA